MYGGGSCIIPHKISPREIEVPKYWGKYGAIVWMNEWIDEHPVIIY